MMMGDDEGGAGKPADDEVTGADVGKEPGTVDEEPAAEVVVEDEDVVEDAEAKKAEDGEVAEA